MATAISIKVNGVALPDGITQLSRSDELLWSEATGRSAESGLLVGSVIATKNTYQVQWGVITQDQYAALIAAIPVGFFNLQIMTNGGTIANISAYRGNIAGEYLGKHGGVGYWRGVSVEFIER